MLWNENENGSVGFSVFDVENASGLGWFPGFRSRYVGRFRRRRQWIKTTKKRESVSGFGRFCTTAKLTQKGRFRLWPKTTKKEKNNSRFSVDNTLVTLTSHESEHPEGFTGDVSYRRDLSYIGPGISAKSPNMEIARENRYRKKLRTHRVSANIWEHFPSGAGANIWKPGGGNAHRM